MLNVGRVVESLLWRIFDLLVPVLLRKLRKVIKEKYNRYSVTNHTTEELFADRDSRSQRFDRFHNFFQGEKSLAIIHGEKCSVNRGPMRNVFARKDTGAGDSFHHRMEILDVVYSISRDTDITRGRPLGFHIAALDTAFVLYGPAILRAGILGNANLRSCPPLLVSLPLSFSPSPRSRYVIGQLFT